MAKNENLDDKQSGMPSNKLEMVNHPKHYNTHPSSVECLDIVRHHNFNVGNVIKYCWRAGLKHEEGKDDLVKQIEDLRKAEFYLRDEIMRLDAFLKRESTQTLAAEPKKVEAKEEVPFYEKKPMLHRGCLEE